MSCPNWWYVLADDIIFQNISHQILNIQNLPIACFYRWTDSLGWKTIVDNNSSDTTKIYLPKLHVSTSIRGFHQKKLVLSSSGSWHNWKMPCQEPYDILVQSDGDRQGAGAIFQVDQRVQYISARKANTLWIGSRATINSVTPTIDRFLDMASSSRVKNRKNWVPASSDEGLWLRSKCQINFGCVWWIIIYSMFLYFFVLPHL